MWLFCHHKLIDDIFPLFNCVAMFTAIQPGDEM